MTLYFDDIESMANLSPHVSTVFATVAGMEPLPLGKGREQSTVYVTSITRPRDDGSYHQEGRAVDFDALTEEANQTLATRLELYLPWNLYDVIHHEDAGGDGTHVHVEYDPNL